MRRLLEASVWTAALAAWTLAAWTLAPRAQAADPRPAQQTPLRPGSPVQSSLLPEDSPWPGHGPSRRFSFRAPATGSYTIEVSSPDFDAYALVLDPRGEVIDEDDDYGIATNASIWLDAEEGVTYTIVATTAGRTGAFTVTVREGEVLFEPQETREATIAYHEEAAARARERGDLARARAMHEQLAAVLETEERWARAAGALEAALEDGPAEPREALDLHRRAGWLRLFRTREFAKARDHYQAMLHAAQSLGDRESAATAHLTLANAEERLGNPRTALEHARRALAILESLGRAADAAEARNERGLARYALGDYAGAREDHEAFLSFLRDTAPGTAREARAMGNLWRDCFQLGDLATAETLRSRHRALAESLDSVEERIRAETFAGLTAIHRGDLSAAASAYASGLDLARAHGFPNLEIDARINLAGIHLLLADYEEAREQLASTIAAARRAGDLRVVANVLLNESYLEERTGDLDAARARAEEGLTIARKQGFGDLEAFALANLCALGLRAGERDEARSLGEAARARAAAIEQPRLVALADERLARVDLAAGDLRAARDRARRALATLEELELETSLPGPLEVLARVAIEEGRLADARQAVRRTEAILDRTASRAGGAVGGGPAAQGLRANYATWGRLEADLVTAELAAAGEDNDRRAGILDRALRSAGRWKGRMLLEGIVEHRRGGRTRESNERIRAIASEDAALAHPEETGAAEIRASLLRPGAILIEYVEGTSTIHAHVIGATFHERVTLGSLTDLEGKIEAYLRLLTRPSGRDAAPAIAREGRELFRILLEPLLEIAGDRERGEGRAGAPPESLWIVPSPAVSLLPFEALVAPGDGDPAHGGRPAAGARGFGALTFVLDLFDVTYGPSTPVLVALASGGPRGRSGRMLVLADPLYPSELRGTGEPSGGPEAMTLLAEGPRPVIPSILAGPPNRGPRAAALPRLLSSRGEGIAIAKLLLRLEGEERGDLSADLLEMEERRSGSLRARRFDLCMGADASRQRLAGDLRDYALLHLAAHGYVDPHSPRRTGIALACDPEDRENAVPGFLTCEEVLDLDLDANLVVLSACDTARGAIRAGEGIESMARAFLYAGARGVVASLWQVSDRAATDTMEAFYRAVLAEGEPPTRALRAAKLALRRREIPSRGFRRAAPESEEGEGGPPPGHPYLWAPFILIGIGR